MNRLRTALAVMLAGSLLGLGACSDEPLPKMAAPESTSPAASPSPSGSPTDPVAPKMPAAARKDTDAGAKAFVRYWVRVLNYGQATGDTAPLERLNTRRCAVCAGFVEAIDKVYTSGGRVKGGQVTILSLRELPRDYGADWGAYGVGKSTPQVILDSNGRRSFPGGKVVLYAYTVRADGAWRMHWMRTPS